MKKIVAIYVLMLLTFLNANGQQSNRFTTLDRYFAGIPLQSSFEKWFDYVASHPYLGIDSTTKKGNYSSFKPGIESYFPFPDSLKVKILFQKTLFFDTISRQFIDSFKSVQIEGIFGNGKSAKKEAAKFFKGLSRELMKYYRHESRNNYTTFFSYNRFNSKNLPVCTIYSGYSEEFKFYYVRLTYYDKKWQVIKVNLPSANTLRH